MVKLTANEIQGLKGILASDFNQTGEAAINYPVWTWSANTFSSKKSFSGVVSSLVKKGFVDSSEYDAGEWIIAITQAGWDALNAVQVYEGEPK
jgi:hypothetical protein